MFLALALLSCLEAELPLTLLCQVLKPGNLSAVGPGQFTVMWHLRGMLLEPDWGRGLNTTTFRSDTIAIISIRHSVSCVCNAVSRFSSNWDCDPLLPLSVWVGILITLLLASILLWAGGHSNDDDFDDDDDDDDDLGSVDALGPADPQQVGRSQEAWYPGGPGRVGSSHDIYLCNYLASVILLFVSQAVIYYIHDN